MTRRQIVRRVAATFAALAALMLLGWVLQPGVAHAQFDVPPDQLQTLPDGTGDTSSVTMRACDPSSGLAALSIGGSGRYTDPQTGKQTARTLLDEYGSCGYTLHHRLNVNLLTKAGREDAGRFGPHMLASTLNSARSSLAALEVKLVRMFYGGDISETLMPSTVAMAKVVGSEWFRRLATVGLVFLAIATAVNLGVRQQTARTLGSVLFALLALGFGTVFVLNPERTVGAYSDGVRELRRGVLALPAYAAGYRGSWSGIAEQQTIATERALWDVFGHRPWVVAQFGSIEGGEYNDYAKRILRWSALKPDDAAIVRKGGDQATQVLQRYSEEYEKVVDEIQEDRPDVYTYVRGDRSDEQISVTAWGLLFAVVAGAVPVILTGAAMLLQAGGDIAWVFSPLLFGALGVWPGWGQKVAQRFLGLFLSIAGGVVFTSLVASVSLYFVQTTIRDAGSHTQGWLEAVAASTVVMGVLILFRRQIMGLFRATWVSPTRFDPVSSLQRAGSKALAVVGATKVATVGSLIGNRLGNRGRDEQRADVEDELTDDRADADGQVDTGDSGLADELNAISWAPRMTGSDALDVDSVADTAGIAHEPAAAATSVGTIDPGDDLDDGGYIDVDPYARVDEGDFEHVPAGAPPRMPARPTPPFGGDFDDDEPRDDRPLHERYPTFERDELISDADGPLPAGVAGAAYSDALDREPAPPPARRDVDPGDVFDEPHEQPEPQPQPVVDLDGHRAPSEPHGMPGWDAVEQRVADPDPDVREQAKRERARLHAEWERLRSRDYDPAVEFNDTSDREEGES